MSDGITPHAAHSPNDTSKTQRINLLEGRVNGIPTKKIVVMALTALFTLVSGVGVAWFKTASDARYEHAQRISTVETQVKALGEGLNKLDGKLDRMMDKIDKQFERMRGGK